MQRHSFTALNSTFVVDSEYQFVKELGQGAYGCVVAARHRRTGEGCAIKKITNINTKVRLNGMISNRYPNIGCAADIDEEMSPGDQARILWSFVSRSNLISRITDSYITFAATRTWVDARSCSIPSAYSRRRSHVSTTWTLYSSPVAISMKFIFTKNSWKLIFMPL